MHRFKIADSMANLVCSKPTFQLVCIKSYRETTNSIFCSAVLKCLNPRIFMECSEQLLYVCTRFALCLYIAIDD